MSIKVKILRGLGCPLEFPPVSLLLVDRHFGIRKLKAKIMYNGGGIGGLACKWTTGKLFLRCKGRTMDDGRPCSSYGAPFSSEMAVHLTVQDRNRDWYKRRIVVQQDRHGRLGLRAAALRLSFFRNVLEDDSRQQELIALALRREAKHALSGVYSLVREYHGQLFSSKSSNLLS